MKDLSQFGTQEFPLRASALPMLVRCPWRAVMLSAHFIDDTTGKAAQTGTALHEMVAAWHEKRDPDLTEVPLADLDDARRQFQAYCEDPRNAKKPILLEQKVEVVIEASSGPIVIHGTLDQVREEFGRLSVWDIKTSGKGVGYILHEYTFQLAAYCIGAGKLLGRPVHPGGFIRTKGYLTRGATLPSPDGVFIASPFVLEDCDLVLDAVRYTVDNIRAGQISIGPGEHCMWCPAEGVDRCIQKLTSLPTV